MAVFIDRGSINPGLVAAENSFLETGPLGEPAEDLLIQAMWQLGQGSLSGGNKGLGGLPNTLRLLTFDQANPADQSLLMATYFRGITPASGFQQLLETDVNFAGFVERLDITRAGIMFSANRHLNSRAELLYRRGLDNRFTFPPGVTIYPDGGGVTAAIRQVIETEQWEPATQALSYLQNANRRNGDTLMVSDSNIAAAAKATLRFGLLGPLAEKLAWYFGRGAFGMGPAITNVKAIRQRNVPKAIIFRAVYGYLAQDKIDSNGLGKDVVASVALDYPREANEATRFFNEQITAEFLGFLSAIRRANLGSLLE